MGSNGSAPDGIVPAFIRSLPAASRKNDRSRLPSAARGMVAGGDDRDDAKSAAVTTRPVAYTLGCDFDLSHQQFVLDASVPIALSLCTPLLVVENDTLLVKTAAVVGPLSPNL